MLPFLPSLSLRAMSRRLSRAGLLFPLLAASLLFMAPLLAESLAPRTEEAGWHSVGLRGQTVSRLAISSSEGEHVLYAETATGLWRMAVSADGVARDWENIDAGLPRNTLGGPALAAWRAVPGRPRHLYALTGSGAFRQLYHTADDGGHWRSVGPAPGQTRQPALAVLPGLQPNGDLIFLATNSRIQRSTDGGATWAPGGPWPAAAGLPSDEEALLAALLVESNAPEHLFALTQSGHVWKSDSGGLSWREIPPVAGEAAPETTALTIAPYFGLRVWAATTAGLALSTDSGATWSLLPLPDGSPVAALAGDPRVPETLYAGVGGAAVYRSDDSGASWISLRRPGASRVLGLVLDTGSRGLLYAATDDGVWVSHVIPLQPTPAPTPTETPTFAPTPTATATATSSPSPTATATHTSTPTITPTPTDTPTPTVPPTATRWPTRLPTRTPTATATSAPFVTPAPPPVGSEPGVPPPPVAPTATPDFNPPPIR